jgi:hypothetical protein
MSCWNRASPSALPSEPANTHMPTRTRIYVFQLGDRAFFVYSLDRTGANIPAKPGDTWLLRGTLQSLNIELDAERLNDLRRVLITDGYYFLRVPQQLLAS